MKREECSLELVGCNMVVAVTQDSVNAALKEYLDAFDADFVNQAYYMDVDESGTVIYESMDYDEVKKAVGLDLYEIAAEKENRSPKQEAAIQKAYNELGFTLGFRFRIGLPEVEDVSRLRDIVTFIESDISSTANVHYTMYLKEFEIIKIACVPRKGYVFTHLIQEPDRPWYFTSMVKLDMQGKNFKDLPKDMQDKLKPKDASQYLNMDDVLSIQQLYMDLNTAKLTDEFKLEGFDPSEDIYKVFQTGFLKNYVKDCEKNGGVILGYFAKQFASSSKEELIKLKNFNFCITPYYKKDGTVDDKKKGLFSLNYLFSSENSTLIDLKKYANAVRWNWVSESEKGGIHGRMVLERNGLMTKLAEHYKRALEYIQLIPKAKAEVNLIELDYALWLENDQTEPIFTYKTGKYEYSYEKKVHMHDSYINTADVSASYEMKCEMTYWGDCIQFKTSIVSDGTIKVDGGEVKARFCDSTLTHDIRLGVDQNGKVVLDVSQEVKEETGNTYVKSDGWMDFLTLGTAKSSMEEVAKSIQKSISSYKNRAVAYAKGAFDDINYWVFPGGRVFSFKKPEISTEGNIMLGITYVQPHDEEDK